MTQLKITLKKSKIGSSQRQLGTLSSLGLRKINQSVIKPDNLCVRGMITKIMHLVEVEEVANATT